MATQVQNRRGSTAEHSTFTGAVGELTVDTTKDTVVVHDGSTAGGAPLLREDGSNSALALGSAASPSLKFTGDTNTGIYSPGADQLALASNSSERIRIGANGEIGIGGANYGTSGQVLTSGGSGAAPSWTTLTVNTDKIEEGNSSAEVVDTGSDGRFVVTTEGTERLRVDSSGRLGVGTSAPISALHVQAGGTSVATAGGDAASDVAIEGASRTYGNGYVANLAVVSNSSLAADAGGGIVLGGKFNGNAQAYYAGLRSGKDNATSGDYSGYLAFATRANGNNLSERMRIDSSGRVGIGTTAPSQLLHLKNATAVSTYSLYENPNTQTYIGANAAGDTVVYNDTANRSVSFFTNATERGRWDPSGRFLVGTSSLTANVRAAFRGNSFGSGVNSTVYMMRDAANPTSGQTLGVFAFTDSNEGIGAEIAVQADANWGSNDYPGRLVFSTTADGASSPTERMRIQATGRKTLFSSDTVHSSSVLSNQGAGTATTLYLGAHSASGYGTGTISFQVYTNGNVQNTNNSYGAISDAKLKENIVDASSQWNDLKALQVRNYNFKEGQTHTQIGLIAQEAELVSPGLVSESPDRDEEGNDLGTVTKSVNYSVLYMKAVKALQEAMERIEQLETEMAAVKAQLS